MNRENYYTDHRFTQLGYHPIHEDKICRPPHRHDHFNISPITEEGFLITNNATLEYIASFNFEYDNGKMVHNVKVAVGERINISFNNGKNGELKIVTLNGLVTAIEPVPTRDMNKSNFIIVLDASTKNSSNVYRIGSRVILDIQKDKSQEIEENDPSNRADEIITGIEIDKMPWEDCGKFPSCKPLPPPPHHHCPPPPPTMYSHDIDWMNISKDFDSRRGYEVLNIVYAKKHPVDVLLCICDTAGNIIHKAIDTGKRISMASNFTWTYRDYISEINKLNIIEALSNYTMDSDGKYVMTKEDINDDFIKSIEENNETFTKNLTITVQLVTGHHLLMYNPKLNAQNRAYQIESKRYTIDPQDLLKAIYKSTTEPPKEDDKNEGGEEPPKDNTGEEITPPSKDPSTEMGGDDTKDDDQSGLEQGEV